MSGPVDPRPVTPPTSGEPQPNGIGTSPSWVRIAALVTVAAAVTLVGILGILGYIPMGTIGGGIITGATPVLAAVLGYFGLRNPPAEQPAQ